MPVRIHDNRDAFDGYIRRERAYRDGYRRVKEIADVILDLHHYTDPAESLQGYEELAQLAVRMLAMR